MEGTNEGLAAARARGRVGGRKPKLTEAQAKLARDLYDSKQHTMAEIASMLNVGRSTLYRELSKAS